MKADQKLQTLFIRSIDAFDGLQESAFFPAVVTSLMTPAALNYANS